MPRKPPPAAPPAGDDGSEDRAARYARMKAAAAERNRQAAAAGREIGPLPRVKNRQRRQKCAQSLRAFCERYLPEWFHLKWSRDHLIAIADLERAILQGGLKALAMPRGSGKTTLAVAAAIWALVDGHRKFVVLVGASEPLARQMLDAIKAALETNAHLAEDFPEVCHPIAALERIANRCKGQVLDGQPTNIKWTDTKVFLPTVRGTAGGIIRVAGITGAIRGMFETLGAGPPVRPDFVLVDDPQTDDSARSASQCEERERLLNGAVLGLAGPRRKNRCSSNTLRNMRLSKDFRIVLKGEAAVAWADVVRDIEQKQRTMLDPPAQSQHADLSAPQAA